jgi:hypothetical protein
MAEPPPIETQARNGRVTRVLETLIPSKNPAAAVYGVLTIGALLTAETALHENYIDTVGSAVLADSLYWLAHAYATMVALCLAGSERLGVGALGRALRHDASILAGAAVPVLVLLVCWLAGASQQTAVSAAVWSTLACLVVFELAAGLRSSSTPGELVLGVGVGLAMGAGILALRIILHS